MAKIKSSGFNCYALFGRSYCLWLSAVVSASIWMLITKIVCFQLQAFASTGCNWMTVVGPNGHWQLTLYWGGYLHLMAYTGLYWWTLATFTTVTVGSQHILSVTSSHDQYWPPLDCSENKLKQLFVFTGAHWLPRSWSVSSPVGLLWNEIDCGYRHYLTGASKSCVFRCQALSSSGGHHHRWWSLFF